MTPFRWSLLAVIALAAGGATLHRALREPDAPALARPADEAALPLALPGAEQAGEPPAVMAPGPATGPPAAARPATQPPLPRIGSEGYGPHIDRALAGNDAAAAWEAVQWLRQCAASEERRQSLELLRGERIPQEMLAHVMLEAEAEARLCQTVTARHQAMLQELALRAMRGGVRQAAAGFASSVNPDDITPALRQEVIDTMRRDANAGHSGSLYGAVVAPAAWGLSDAERLGYLYAYGEMTGLNGQAFVKQLVGQRTLRLKTEPTPQQLAAAQAVGQQIVDRARAGKQP